jgi:hypothetical protein
MNANNVKLPLVMGNWHEEPSFRFINGCLVIPPRLVEALWLKSFPIRISAFTGIATILALSRGGSTAPGYAQDLCLRYGRFWSREPSP